MLTAHLSEDIELVDVWILAKLHNWFLLSKMITVQRLHSRELLVINQRSKLNFGYCAVTAQ